MTMSHDEVVVSLIGAKRGAFPLVRVTGRPEKVALVTNLHSAVHSMMADTTEL